MKIASRLFTFNSLHSLRLSTFVTLNQNLNQNLQQADSKVNDIISRECQRQNDTVNLIPSENYTSLAVQQAIGSIMNSKYSEGLPLNRYYGGNQFIDKIEILCQNRALQLFQIDPKQWGVNVQAHSLSPANFHVLAGLLGNHDRVMSLSFQHGGHLSHGQSDGRQKLSGGSFFFESLNYSINEKSGLIDYSKLEEQAQHFLPKVIFGGADLYTHNIDFKALKEISDKIGAILVVDLGQTAGLVATGLNQCPFGFADIVTSATHKSLRGPRGAMVFYRQGVKGVDKKGNEVKYDYKNKIENAIFPGSQGGPHNHTISGIAVALKEAQQGYFKTYCQQSLKNSTTLANSLLNKNFSLLSGGTENHLVLVQPKSKGICPSQLQTLLQNLHIDVFRQTLPSGKKTFLSDSLALGSFGMTTRGCEEKDFSTIAEFIDRAATILKELQIGKQEDAQAAITKALQENQSLQQLQQEVLKFAHSFQVPGI